MTEAMTRPVETLAPPAAPAAVPAAPAAPAKEPYLGSVRFFKHIFLGILILMILVPTVTSVVLGIQMVNLKSEQKELLSELAVLQEQVRSLPEPEGTEPQGPLGTEEISMDKPPLPVEMESPAYTQLYPDFYAPEAAWGSVDEEKTCYLTFDDGPSPRTDEVLAILEQEGILATFFVTKQNSEDNVKRLQAAAQAGHTIGMHSATHDYKLIYSSVEAFLADYYELYTWIRENTGASPTVFRFPGGSINGYNHPVYQEIIAEMTRRGFVYFDWNISSADAALPAPTAQQITDNCLTGLHKLKRSIVLMHDSSSRVNTVTALPNIIKGYRDQGFTFAPLTPEVKPVTFGYRDWNP